MRTLAAAVIFCCACAAASGSDWPGLRGPQHDGAAAGQPGAARRATPPPPPTHEATAELTLVEAFHGTTRLVDVDGKRLEITIPVGQPIVHQVCSAGVHADNFLGCEPTHEFHEKKRAAQRVLGTAKNIFVRLSIEDVSHHLRDGLRGAGLPVEGIRPFSS
jgi:hypothetical protein